MSGCCGPSPVIMSGSQTPRVDVETVLLCDVMPDGTVVGLALVEPVYDTNTGARVATRTVDPATGADYTPTGTLGPCATGSGCGSVDTQLLCDVDGAGAATPFLRAIVYNCDGAVTGTVDLTLDGTPYTVAGVAQMCPQTTNCASPTTPTAMVGLCLADGTPIAVTVVRDCDGVVTSEGWINLATGAWSAGAPPAGMVVCGDSRSVQVSGTFCDIDAAGEVVGLVLIEYSYAADGTIDSVRLVDATTGATYTPQGTISVCPAGIEQPEQDLVVLCDVATDGGVTQFMRDYRRDENGAIVGYADYSLDGAAYTPTGTVGICAGCQTTQVCVRSSGRVEFLTNPEGLADNSVDSDWTWSPNLTGPWWPTYRLTGFPGWTTVDGGTPEGQAHWVAPHPGGVLTNTGEPGEGPDVPQPPGTGDWYVRAAFTLPDDTDPASIRISTTALNADQLAVEWRLNGGAWQPAGADHTNPPYVLPPTAVPGAQPGVNEIIVHVRETVAAGGAAGLLLHVIAEYDVDPDSYLLWTQVMCDDGRVYYLDDHGVRQDALPDGWVTVPCGTTEPCRNSSTVLVCDVPADSSSAITPTIEDATAADVAQTQFQNHPGPYAGLWSGGPFVYPAGPGPSPEHLIATGQLTADMAGCDGASGTLTISVRVRNDGPDDGQAWDGALRLFRGTTALATHNALAWAPVGWQGTLTVSAPVTAAEIAAGDIYVALILETYHLGAKSWTADQFSATLELEGCEVTSSTQFLRTLVTDCVTGEVVSTTDTTLDGDPYTVTGEVSQCVPSEPAECRNCEAVVLCDVTDDAEPHSFLRTVCRDCTGVVISVLDTELDGATPYAVTGTVGSCGPDTCQTTSVQTVRLCDLDPTVEADGDGRRCAVPFLRHLAYDCAGDLLGFHDTGLDGTTPYTPVQVVDCQCKSGSGITSTIEVPWTVVSVIEDPAGLPRQDFIYTVSPENDPSRVGTIRVHVSRAAGPPCAAYDINNLAFSNTAAYTLTLDAVAQEMSYLRVDLLDFDTFEPVGINSGMPEPDRMGGTAGWNAAHTRIVPSENNGTGYMYWDAPPATVGWSVLNQGGGVSCSALSFQGMTVEPGGCCGGESSTPCGDTEIAQLCDLVRTPATPVPVPPGSFTLTGNVQVIGGTLQFSRSNVPPNGVAQRTVTGLISGAACELLFDAGWGGGGAPAASNDAVYLAEVLDGATVIATSTVNLSNGSGAAGPVIAQPPIAFVAPPTGTVTVRFTDLSTGGALNRDLVIRPNTVQTEGVEVTATSFLRAYTYDCTGLLLTTTDTELDGSTAYTPQGQVGVCSGTAGTATAADSCTKQVIERCGCSDEDGDGVGEVMYTELWAIDPCGTDAPVLVGTYEDGDPGQPFTPTAPVDCTVEEDTAPTPLSTGVRAVTGTAAQNLVTAFPGLQSVTVTAIAGSVLVSMSDGVAVPIPAGVTMTWSVAKDEDSALAAASFTGAAADAQYLLNYTYR
ncbi:hypothetical protein [Nonomuraea sp. NPDC052265]|uniref:hypothetical protein n=1 Tax=Nonomuraea sp. NPDC052265 TaxID=3364374 RepID=UPI0037CA8263